ncbi:hypothetical protein HMPREF0179_05195 [Bilophila wadsworthia 3_1_6]|uniref:Uncharacterized protein n=1 Tax=Bilophila wadsworthia (strain 3_1_6) TaxID=563192 RepID=S2LBP1_BILW3|nr:hypothetical protein HMPREF0179_05195 [Bilophila wadsworthia 3_1_6]
MVVICLIMRWLLVLHTDYQVMRIGYNTLQLK